MKQEDFMKTLRIKGMSCQHCVKAVKKALEEIDGVTEVTVDLAKGEAAFEETRPVDEAVVKEKIQKAGYEVV
jgi:copper chaperone